jgi:hypothetical protein
MTTAEVRLHGRRVGLLHYDKGRTEFTYEDDLDSPAHQTLGQRRMAERVGQDPEATARIVSETVERMRSTWTGALVDEARGRFEPLARHYSDRLRSLPISAASAGG